MYMGLKYNDYSSCVTRSSTSSAVGSSTKPVYINSSGVATACSSTVGSSTKPIYMSSGTLTASSSTIGSSTTPVYLNSGTITSTGIDLSDIANKADIVVNNISEINCGAYTASTAGSCFISHGMSATPDAVFYSVLYPNSVDIEIHTISLSPTQIYCYVSCAVTALHWLAIIF